MEPLHLLRRLVEHHNFVALREACLDLDSSEPGVQILLALADFHLGDASVGHREFSTVDHLTLDARVDLAALHLALGEQNQAVTLLEAAQQENAEHALLLARLAVCRKLQGRDDMALALFQRSLDLRPSIAVYHHLLQLHRDSGRLTDMATCLDAARRFWSEEQADWPDDQRRLHSEQLRGAQLDLLLAQEGFEAAEAWVEQQHAVLTANEWCALLCGLATRLAAVDRHSQAEEWLRTGLHRYPEELALYDQLAALTEIQGRTHQTIAVLKRAIHLASAQHKSTEGLLIRLSEAALQSNPVVAREAAERALGPCGKQATWTADEVSEGRLLAEVALAGVEAREEDYVAAERRYRNALERRPQAIPALEGLGRLLMQLGRIDEAVALFERVKALDPTRGHGALINARRFPDDADTLQRLEQFARTPGMEGSVRTGMLFKLAAAWEKREDYDKAFALADEANAAGRKALHYDPKTHRQHCARVRHAFPKALYEHRPGSGLRETSLPVFIVGMPRSGTTLVEQILSGHSRIHGAGELGTIPRVIAGLDRWERHTASGRSYPDCVDDLDPHVTRRVAENVLKELREYAPDADHVVDKLPHNFENVGLIKLLFPQAKIISVHRDARDIAISNYFMDYANKHNGMGFAYHLEWIAEQLTDYNLLMQHWETVFSGEILNVRYEDVVKDPTASARTMLAYIGVDWEPQVLEFHTLERPVRTASLWQVRQPLYTSSLARWRNYRQHLGPFANAAKRMISIDPIEMVTLPEPGWLNRGVDRYREGDLDGAEYLFKRLLTYLPEHAAARFMLGLIYVRKGHCDDGIGLMELALERCPWNRHWRSDLAQAYRLVARDQDAVALDAHRGSTAPLCPNAEESPLRLDYLLCEESTCPSSGSPITGDRC